ncbi:hypothetical protein QE109_06570 [Fusibacter bizertensis]|uniref:Uncharacterized protein n=1 Tax=Fusibacter bizertensis TaxID=1488331 RepID=A0ABT6NBK3_9FIRM|nr:hypothetical protein [Fusibacter bizertensis]MDH8677803.1 hypothetical protein [Fusibacter bizertensis]
MKHRQIICGTNNCCTAENNDVHIVLNGTGLLLVIDNYDAKVMRLKGKIRFLLKMRVAQ